MPCLSAFCLLPTLFSSSSLLCVQPREGALSALARPLAAVYQPFVIARKHQYHLSFPFFFWPTRPCPASSGPTGLWRGKRGRRNEPRVQRRDGGNLWAWGSCSSVEQHHAVASQAMQFCPQLLVELARRGGAALALFRGACAASPRPHYSRGTALRGKSFTCITTLYLNSRSPQ